MKDNNVIFRIKCPLVNKSNPVLVKYLVDYPGKIELTSCTNILRDKIGQPPLDTTLSSAIGIYYA